MSEPETFTFTQTVKLVDSDGRPIREGSVLREINDGEQGVVTHISRAGGQAISPFDTVGDIAIKTSRGTSRCTNRYNQWRHVPRNEQTYEQRLLSWKLTPYDHEEDRGVSEDEGLAVDGIMALLPDDLVDWDYGPFPDRLDNALTYLDQHIEELKNPKTDNDK